MIRIVDRRLDSKNKSSVNRSRFIRRFKSQIKKAVSDTIDKSGIRDLAEGKRIGIPGKDINEPQFRTGHGGVREQVLPGNDRFTTGETFDRPQGGSGGRGSKASPDGEGVDDFVFTLTKDEFMEIFFEELALPNLVKRHLASITEFKRVRAGYSQTGVPTNINLVRTMRGAAGRRIAVGGPYAAKLRELETELERLLLTGSESDPEVKRVRQEIQRLRTRADAVPFIDSFDLRYNNHVRIAQPTTQAVMFCLMDISGSMDEEKKNIAKRFFTLLYLFLTRTYEHIDVVFIRHHTVAEEVDEENFFHSRETGGTVVSSALKLMRKVIEQRYGNGLWNIYGAQASDGDNWLEDSVLCYDLLNSQILGLTQFYAYIEIAEDTPQNLWEEYEKVQAAHEGVFAMRRIKAVTDIYPVFHDLFKKRG
ncbi:MAG: YeaH/YhbH family protein [Holophaga sp.]|nr:YeaH/YhbH family protein [Holophaga sp.]